MVPAIFSTAAAARARSWLRLGFKAAGEVGALIHMMDAAYLNGTLSVAVNDGATPTRDSCALCDCCPFGDPSDLSILCLLTKKRLK